MSRLKRLFFVFSSLYDKKDVVYCLLQHGDVRVRQLKC